ncbi:hypothetical protein BDK51DRAFT_25986 [Blyttiomyces helicus]|uniref:Uncharacterized protein n=1 Tax=Blyttiomyces helicus TaxID=388810 RepID=A0A4P9WJ00_9FUNG|nr:hypothetical protein BDK51DRAFT_25986 [Blyttiomyces helicus]|eukprot:RKO91438.1 hypothetical protein BDK51DRAFT_25986 [Blyttiomyces helicus]
MLNAIFFAASLIAAVLITFPAFLASRIDGGIGWPWAVVFVPMWVVDFVALVTAVRAPAAEDDGSVDEEDEELAPAGRFSEDRARENLERMKRRQARKIRNSARRVLRVSSVALLTVCQVFVVLQLDSVVTWPIAMILNPWFAFKAMHAAYATAALIPILLGPSSAASGDGEDMGGTPQPPRSSALSANATATADED